MRLLTNNAGVQQVERVGEHIFFIAPSNNVHIIERRAHVGDESAAWWWSMAKGQGARRAMPPGSCRRTRFTLVM